MKKSAVNRVKKMLRLQKHNNDPRYRASRTENLEERFAIGSLLPFLPGSNLLASLNLAGAAPSAPNVEHIDFSVSRAEVVPVEIKNSPAFSLDESYASSADAKSASVSAPTAPQKLFFRDVESLNQEQSFSLLTPTSLDVALFDPFAENSSNSSNDAPLLCGVATFPNGNDAVFNKTIAQSPVSSLDVAIGIIPPAVVAPLPFNFNASASGASGGGDESNSVSTAAEASNQRAEADDSSNENDVQADAQVKSIVDDCEKGNGEKVEGEKVDATTAATSNSSQNADVAPLNCGSQKTGNYQTKLEMFSDEQDWRFVAYGSGVQSGSVDFAFDSATMREGNSFATSLKKTVVVPSNAVSFQFSYDDLQFDASASERMSDAFEAALVDSDGYSLVSSWTTNRDAFYNVSEGETERCGSSVNTSVKDGVTTVSVELDSSIAERDVDLVFRLVNNDGDTESSIRLLNYGFTVFSTNAAPTVSASDVVGTEGNEVVISADFSDEDIEDAHLAFVDWGDGSAEESLVVSEQNGLGVASGSHIYPDDGVYDVVIRVVDQDAGLGIANVKANIANVAPTVDAYADFAAVANGDYYALETTIIGSFIDPGFDNDALGTTETFVATIDWGDGSVENVPVDVVQGADGVATSGTFEARRVLAQDGVQNIKISVADDDGGIGETTLTFVASTIDVKPAIRNQTKKGSVSLRRGYYPIVIGGTNDFDPKTLDVASLEFGPGAAPELDGKLTFSDVARLGDAADGVMDAIAHFDTQDSLISTDASVAWLTGRTLDGEIFIGVGTLSVPSLSGRVPFAYSEAFPRLRATQFAPASNVATKFYVVDNSSD